MTDEALKVLLLAGQFEVRGTSRYTLRLAERLPEYGVQPLIVCSDARRIDPARRKNLLLREYQHLDSPLIGRLIREWVIPPLQENPPDVIHIQSRPLLSLGIWLSRRLERPFVLTMHDFPPPGRSLSWDPVFGKKIIAVSDSVGAAVRQAFGVADEMVTVIHSGVEADPHVPLEPVLDPGHLPVVGVAGPLEVVKGLPYFLGAAQRVREVRPDVEFLIAGAGPEEFNLRRLARLLAIDRHVTFIPQLRDFTAALAAMDIYCLPSLQQGLGTVMLEAMALGRPVIATRVGGVYSVVRDGDTGLLVPPSQSGPLAERILELLQDPLRARAIGEAGRLLVRQHFRVETMLERTAALYRTIAAETAVAAASAVSASVS